MAAGKTRARRRVTVVDNRPLAQQVGERIRRARLRAGMTQAQVAQGRYTSAYISALERGHAKPSMAAMAFIAERLGVPVTEFVAAEGGGSERLEADLRLASGDVQAALDAYRGLLDRVRGRAERAEILRGTAEALCRLGRGLEAIGPATEAAELFRALKRPADAVDATYWLAYAHYQQDNATEARALLADIVAQLRGGVEVLPDFRFRVLMAQANVESRAGEHAAALAFMEEARALSEGLDLRRRAILLAGLAESYRQTGDLEASITTGIKSMALYDAADAELEAAALANNLALTYLRLGNLARSGELLASARSSAERLGARSLLAHVADSEAQLALESGELPAARRHVADAIAIAGETGNHHALASAHETAARIAQRRRRPAEAAAHLESAIAVLREHGPAARLRDALGSLADLKKARGDVAAAADLYAEALRIRR